MPSEAYRKLDKVWRATCKILFGREIGGLERYEGWLSEMPEPIEQRKSSVSGKETAYSVLNYCRGSQSIAFDEIDYSKKSEPISIDDTKDIDSLLRAISERVAYAGGVILGNSGFVDDSSNVSNSFYVYKAGRIDDSECISQSSFTKESKNIFGSTFIGKSEYVVRGTLNYRCKRTFEAWNANTCSDAYFSHNITACSDVMFCFNVMSKRHAIGNLELDRDKYAALKAKLLPEIAGELEKNGRLPSLAKLATETPTKPPNLDGKAHGQPQRQDMAPIERAFGEATSIVLGKKYQNVKSYAAWLERNAVAMDSCPSAASGKPVFFARFGGCKLIPKSRIVSFEEAEAIGNMVRMQATELESFSWKGAPALLGRIGFMTPEFKDGVGENVMETPIYSDATNCFHVFDATYSKLCAYCFWARDSDHLIGTSLVFGSSFCIKCYNSVKLTRCFELDSCRECTGAYFCHNCENVHDSMFCFNAKNLKYAIGNAEVGKEAFEKAKKLLLAEINSSLEKTGDYKRSIYEIAPAKKAR